MVLVVTLSRWSFRSSLMSKLTLALSFTIMHGVLRVVIEDIRWIGIESTHPVLEKSRALSG